MNNVLNYVFNVLNNIAPTSLRDLQRDKNGKIIIKDIAITYVINKALSSNENKVKKTLALTIDVWCKNKDEEFINNLMDLIISKFKNEIIRLDHEVFLFNEDVLFMQDLKDDDKNIIRKRLNYIVSLYKE